MRRYIQLAFVKALVISGGSTLIYALYGLVSKDQFKISLAVEIIFFLAIFVVSLIEYLWENRKK